MYKIPEQLAAELRRLSTEALRELKRDINEELRNRGVSTAVPYKKVDVHEPRPPRPAGKSGHRGVSLDITNQKYRARVYDKIKQKSISLGYYETAELASLAILNYELGLR